MPALRRAAPPSAPSPRILDWIRNDPLGPEIGTAQARTESGRPSETPGFPGALAETWASLGFHPTRTAGTRRPTTIRKYGNSRLGVGDTDVSIVAGDADGPPCPVAAASRRGGVLF